MISFTKVSPCKIDAFPLLFKRSAPRFRNETNGFNKIIYPKNLFTMFALAEELKGADHQHTVTYRCQSQDAVVDITGARAYDLNHRFHTFSVSVITPSAVPPSVLKFEPCPDHMGCFGKLTSIESEPLYAR